MAKATEAELHKTLRSLEQQLQQVQASDFFPGKEGARAAADAVSHAAPRSRPAPCPPDEPSPTAAPIPVAVDRRLPGPHVGHAQAPVGGPAGDRVAGPALHRSVAHFPLAVGPAEVPEGGARLRLRRRHVHARRRTGHLRSGRQQFRPGQGPGHLASSAARPRHRRRRHFLDEAPGLEMVVRGLQAQHADDDDLLQAAIGLFDTLYAAMKAPR